MALGYVEWENPSQMRMGLFMMQREIEAVLGPASAAAEMHRMTEDFTFLANFGPDLTVVRMQDRKRKD